MSCGRWRDLFRCLDRSHAIPPQLLFALALVAFQAGNRLCFHIDPASQDLQAPFPCKVQGTRCPPTDRYFVVLSADGNSVWCFGLFYNSCNPLAERDCSWQCRRWFGNREKSGTTLFHLMLISLRSVT